ncbi:hypothetical protein NDU88_004812 [Pleurodeles waltl]|uniref:Uncharacterized protein n=1 Tax=Pleurodeles waltl TaxID=8319 RepID=A0AAV7WX11_PLEWA|nr:hypothetical protein NDU88_004812 [Pleurodeles waltl]
MLVGSVLPLRQRSIGREGGGRRRPGRLPAPGAADEPLSRRRPQACSPRSAWRLRGGRSPRITDVGHLSIPAPMSAPAALGGPSERPQCRRHRHVARRRAELGSQAAIMDRGQTTLPRKRILNPNATS